MPSALHEGLIVPFRNRPGLAAELLSRCGLALPASCVATIDDAALTELTPAELRADLVVVVRDEGGATALAIVLEAQLGIDARKAFTWPRYLISARSRFTCPALVLVVTPYDEVATWAREPLELGPGSVMQPTVLGPRQIPRITRMEDARASPELALLSLLAARDAPLEIGLAIAAVTERAIAELPEALAAQYFDAGRAGISDALREALEEQMTAAGYKYQSEFARRYVDQGLKQGLEQGRRQGYRELAERVLSARFGPLPPAVLARLDAADVETLDAFTVRASDASSLEEVFSA